MHLEVFFVPKQAQRICKMLTQKHCIVKTKTMFLTRNTTKIKFSKSGYRRISYICTDKRKLQSIPIVVVYRK